MNFKQFVEDYKRDLQASHDSINEFAQAEEAKLRAKYADELGRVKRAAEKKILSQFTDPKWIDVKQTQIKNNTDIEYFVEPAHYSNGEPYVAVFMTNPNDYFDDTLGEDVFEEDLI